MKPLAQHIQEGLSKENNENLLDDVVGKFDDKEKKGITEEVSEEDLENEEVSENLCNDLEKEKPTE